MSMKAYVRIWLILTLLLSYEAFALNFNPFISIFATLKENLPYFKDLNLSPTPGKTISIWYGWIGFVIMLLTNPYILRKRLPMLRKFGKISGWLDFHIFCGLTGPIFIFFHSNFKVGGLVAISFWSMFVSFASGIIGKYFYLQMARQKMDLEKDLERYEKGLKDYQEQLAKMGPAANNPIEALKSQTIAMAGVSITPAAGTVSATDAVGAIMTSFAGDIRLWFRLDKLAAAVPYNMRGVLKGYAITKRRISTLEHFQKIMGYWHAFHMPFAVFMYVVALIHIATALLLMVDS